MFGLTPGSVGSALTVLYIPNRWLAAFTGRFHIFSPTGMSSCRGFTPTGCSIYVSRSDETQLVRWPALLAARVRPEDWVSPIFGSSVCLGSKVLR